MIYNSESDYIVNYMEVRMRKDIRTFDDVRNMNDEELANWLSLIWRTGWNVATLGSPITTCPNFNDRLSSKTSK